MAMNTYYNDIAYCGYWPIAIANMDMVYQFIQLS